MQPSVTLDEAWKKFTDNFEQYFSLLPCKLTFDCLVTNGLAGCPNILFYAAGFPIQLVISLLITKLYGPHNVEQKTWEKEVIFNESAYHFEIDFSIPTQTTNLDKINSLVKEIITHKCIHNDRHIIVLHNIDVLLRNLGAFQTFRVFLERYYANVIFICTTNKVSSIEKPLLSRLLALRLPLFSHEQINTILRDLGLEPVDSVPISVERNLAYYMYSSVAKSVGAPHSTSLRYPFLQDYFNDSGKPTIDQLRSLTQKLHAYDVSISALVFDLMTMCKSERQEHILHLGVKIDWLLASTNSNRRPLYIEYLLNVVNNTVTFE